MANFTYDQLATKVEDEMCKKFGGSIPITFDSGKGIGNNRMISMQHVSIDGCTGFIYFGHNLIQDAVDEIMKVISTTIQESAKKDITLQFDPFIQKIINKFYITESKTLSTNKHLINVLTNKHTNSSMHFYFTKHSDGKWHNNDGRAKVFKDALGIEVKKENYSQQPKTFKMLRPDKKDEVYYHIYQIDQENRTVTIPVNRAERWSVGGATFTKVEIIKQEPDYLEYIVVRLVALSMNKLSKKYTKVTVYLSNTNKIMTRKTELPHPQWLDAIKEPSDLYQNPYNELAHEYLLLDEHSRAKYMGNHIWLDAKDQVYIKIMNEHWIPYPKVHNKAFDPFMTEEIQNELAAVQLILG